jgi:uncharacterized protein
MDRVFLDANVLFSASRSADSRLLWLWQCRGVQLLTSSYAIEETTRNLPSADARRRLARLLRRVGIVATPSTIEEVWDVRLPAKDQPILAAAVYVGATHLVTGDKKHFRRYFGHRIHGVLIQTPAQFRDSKTRAG